MPRALSFALDQIQVAAERRQPAFKVLVYDILRTDAGNYINSIGDIVRGTVAISPLVGPRDFTADCVSISVEEVAGDYTGNGVAATAVTLTITDPYAQFDSVNVIASPTGDGRWLRRGNVVRVYFGDYQVPENEWPLIFTGKITGNAGVNRTRVTITSQIQVKAVGREADYIRYSNTSSVFGQGTTHQQMAETIAQEDMALDVDEIEFTGFSALITGQTTTQFVDEPPLVSIAKCMFPSGLMPYFSGEGKLSQTFGSITKSNARVYENLDIFMRIENVFGEVNPYNRIVVRGLNANLSKVIQPYQVLAEISVTTGFFTQSEEIDAYWSEDRTILAENVELEIVKSVNGGLIPLGGSEDFDTIVAPGPGEGFIGATLLIDTGFAPELLIFLTATYVTLAAIPDNVFTDPLSGTGFTIPLGRMEQAAQLAIGLLTMARVGRGTYQFVGTPFEYVFQEITSIAEVSNLRTEDINELVIDNHLLQTQAAVDTVAREVLFREQAKGNPRSIEMLHDLALIPNDKFEIPGGRAFLIERINYTLARGASSIIANIDAYEVTSGVFQL